MRTHSCVKLGSVAFDLFLRGKKDGICVFGCMGWWGWGWGGHTRNIPSSPQEINLFERAARLKIGKPQTIALELIAQIFVRSQEDSRELKFVLCLVFMCVLWKYWSSLVVMLFCFWHISACLQLSKHN